MAEADGRAGEAGTAAAQLPQPMDWPARIRERLAGSQPRHQLEERADRGTGLAVAHRPPSMQSL